MAQTPPLLDSITRLIRDLRQHYDDSVRDLGLTLAKARVLITLIENEGATQAELAARIGIEAPTMKRHIEGLEAEGYLERRALPGDGRKRAIYPTARARETCTEEFIQRLRRDLMEGISLEEQRIACEILDRVAANVAKLSAK